MSKFIKTPELGGLPQGEFSFQPLVKIYADYTDPALLQSDINTALLGVPAIPNLFWHVHDIKYEVTQIANNDLRYSALIFYTVVERI